MARTGKPNARNHQTKVRRRHRMASATAAAFVPTDIAGLVGWYDFSDGGASGSLYTDTARTTHATADADNIKGVADKSGAGVHLSETTNPPILKLAIKNSLSVARFDGVITHLSATVTADASWTVFLVINKRSAVSGSTGTGWGLGGNAQFTTNSAFHATNWVYFSNQGGAAVNTGGAANAWRLMVLRANTAGSFDIYADGGTATNFDPDDQSSTGTTWQLGAPNTGDVDIAEVYRYDSALNATNTNLAGNALATKWGTTWTTAV